MTVEELQVLITANTKQLQDELNATKLQLNKFEKSVNSTTNKISNFFKKMIPVAAITLGIKKLTESSVQAYKDQIQNETRLLAVMHMLDEATNDDIRDIISLTEAEQAYGVVADEVQLAGAQELSTYIKKADSIKKLIPQLNNMVTQQYGYNATQEEAINIATMMGKVLEGQTGALSRYGYYFDEAQEKILKFGTEEEKVATLTEIIHDSIGDVNQALGDTAIGKQIQLANAWGDVKEQLGFVIVQVKQVLVPVFQVLVSWLATAVSFLRQFLQLLGLSANKQNSANKAIMGGASAEESYGDAVEDANEKQKEQLSTIDEMNVLKEDTSDDNTSSDDGGSSGINTIDYNIGIDGDVEVEERVQIFTEKIKKSLEELRKAFEPFGKNIADGFKWLYNEILVPLASWTINDVVPAFFHIFAGAINIANQAIEDIKPIFEWLWENALKPMAEWTGGVIVDVLNGLGDALNWISQNETAMAILEGIAIAIGLVSAAIAIYNGAMAICNIVTGIFSGIMTVLTAPITLVVLAIGALIAVIILCVKHWDEIKAAAIKCWDVIKTTWDKVATWFNENIVLPVKNFFEGMWKGLTDGARNAWDGIKNVFSTVGSFFKDTFTKAWTAVKNVFSVGGKIFDGIKDGIVSSFKTIVNGIIGGINKAISVPFNGINKALNKIKGIDILGAKPFDFISTISVPQIPKLAQGGIVNKPTLAQIGEAGKEVIMPLERNTEWIDDLASKINTSNGSGQPINLTVQIGDEQVASKFIDLLQEKQFETNGEVVVGL